MEYLLKIKKSITKSINGNINNNNSKNKNSPILKEHIKIYNKSLMSNKNNISHRQLKRTCHELYKYDKETLYDSCTYKSDTIIKCYPCNKRTDIYIFMC